MDDKRFESKYPTKSRFEEIEKILGFIKEGKSVQMVSIPGVGRSNLLGLLSFNRNVRIEHLGEDEQVKFHFVLVNFTEVKGKPLTDLTKFLFLSLVDSLRERNILEDYKKVDEIFKDSISSQDELVIFHGLKKTIDYLALEKDLTVTFLFDRFESYLPNLTSQFFINLRALRNQAKYKFSAVFSLNHPLSETLDPTIWEDFYDFLAENVVYLPIKDDPSLEFRTTHLQEIIGTKIDRKIIDEVVELTGGHARLTRFALEEIAKDKPENLKDSLLKSERINSALFEIWKALTPAEQEALETLKNVPEYLVNVGLIKNNMITIPLFSSFIEKQKTEHKNEDFVFDQTKNEIRKGRVTYSNGLTSSEFKLFKFLLENKESIVLREDVINAVWGELKSTAGVTEQALDQLIFRLRKKIEENPNSPIHIQTIKGRGYQFKS